MRKILLFGKKEDGNFTIEASIMFPIILMLTLCLIFFSLIIYQKAVLHYGANAIAERLAYVWDNSSKDVQTGKFDKYTTFDGGDGLYWRTFNNQYLSKVGLDLFKSPDDYAINIGETGGSLPAKKLARASKDVLPAGVTGKVRYENGLVGSEIVIELTSPLDLPKVMRDLFQIDAIKVEVSRAVIEPTEFIRSTDLVMYAVKEIANYSDHIKAFVKQWNRNRK